MHNKIFREAPGFLVFLAIAFICGMWYGGRYERRHVAEVTDGRQIAVDGKVIPSLEVCSRGCKTEDDVTCEKFTKMLKTR